MGSEDVLAFIESLRPEREDVASEVEVLQSIYGDEAIRLWKPPSPSSSHATRYEAVLSLPVPHEEVSIRVLVSLPENYPAEAAPQLQLLSRYIGAFGADPALFGAVLRTFISVTSGVEWAGDVCVFDGLQNVLERCATWYGERLSADAVGELQRVEEHPHSPERTSPPPPPPIADAVAPLPDGIKIFVAEPITDRKSAFVGRACAISDPVQVPIILAHLMSDRRISRAAHPIINAWRCTVGNLMHQDNDDDGETAAGGRIAHLLHILEVDNVLVVVTRYFGGIHLGPDRFKHINQAARNALELGGFLDGPAAVGPKARGRGR
ncbi:ribosomal protein S5 domain 2-type protein [Mycena amicta]|nr:ribosomal protein S5 domain 2-type protein [Mycena amicta]